MLEQKGSSAIKPKPLGEGMKKGQVTELCGGAPLNYLGIHRLQTEKQVNITAKLGPRSPTPACLPFLMFCGPQ